MRERREGVPIGIERNFRKREKYYSTVGWKSAESSIGRVIERSAGNEMKDPRRICFASKLSAVGQRYFFKCPW